MKNHLILGLALLLTSVSFVQVGIGTTTPSTTLEVIGVPASPGVLDGVRMPNLTGDQLSAKTYTAAQAGTIVYVTAADATPSGATINVNSAGFYYFTGTVWEKTSASGAAQKVVFSAEYDGASLQADGTNNSLSLNAFNIGSPDFTNYYEVKNFDVDGVGTNDYDIVFRTTLPQDFGAWAVTDAITIQFTGTADANFNADVFEQGNGTALQDNANVAGTGIGAFVQNTLANGPALSALVAGDTLIIRIKLTITDVVAQGTSIIRIGDITLNYNKL
jgi:hypothetical protein